MFPEVLYRLARTPASTGPLIELFSVAETSSDTSPNINATIAGVPKDKVLIVTNLTVDMDPGLAQSIRKVVFSGRTPAGTIVTISQLGFVAVVDLRSGFNWQGEVAIGGAGVEVGLLICDVVFNAGVAANQIVFNAYGYVIPRGNIAPF